MTRTQALTKARKLCGKNAAIRFDASAPDSEQRAVNEIERNRILKAKRDIANAMQARSLELCRLDPEYQRLRGEHEAEREHWRKSKSCEHRATVGTLSCGFYMIEAQGETYEECFRTIERKRAEGRAKTP